MKILYNIAFLICLVSILFYGCGGKASNPETSAIPKLLLTLDNSSKSIGQTVNLSLEFQDMQDSVFGISLQLDYDNSIVTFDDSTGITPGDFLGNNILQFARDVDSSVHISLTKLRGQAGSSGSGAIATLTFIASNTGNFVFGIESANINLYDSDGNTINISTLEIGSVQLHVN
jgi:hypothetical protein